MALNNEDKRELATKLKSIAASFGTDHEDEPSGTTISRLTTHGILQALADPESVAPRLQKHLPGANLLEAFTLSSDLSASVKDFFYKLEDEFKYNIDSSLISYLTFPHEGKTWTKDDESDPSQISVVFTFMGQFIDHDLTKNIIDLVAEQSQNPIQDFATPLVDLDSVYGPRFDPGFKFANVTGDKFDLVRLGPNAYDAKRSSEGKAIIPDGRNDENQIILQIHVLLMRLHNTFVIKENKNFDQAKKETINTWQSIVINDYLPNIVQQSVLNYVIGELGKPNYGALLHKPRQNPPPGQHPLGMPHEFGVGFRFGHSQLRGAYKLNPDNAFVLFDNLAEGPDFHDLRGDRALTKQRIIDWSFFIDAAEHPSRRSNKIDTKVTQKVFNLPESTIPDNIKKFGNLPQRNLVRSAQLKLTSGERLADKYGVTKLTNDEVESHAGRHYLFKQNPTKEFATPLWYYLLREAELKGSGLHLGPLGSRLVAEVVAGGVYYDADSYVHDAGWKSLITNTREVSFKQMAHYVQTGPT